MWAHNIGNETEARDYQRHTWEHFFNWHFNKNVHIHFSFFIVLPLFNSLKINLQNIWKLIKVENGLHKSYNCNFITLSQHPVILKGRFARKPRGERGLTAQWDIWKKKYGLYLFHNILRTYLVKLKLILFRCVDDLYFLVKNFDERCKPSSLNNFVTQNKGISTSIFYMV